VEDEMGEAGSTILGHEKCIQNFSRKAEGKKDHL